MRSRHFGHVTHFGFDVIFTLSPFSPQIGRALKPKLPEPRRTTPAPGPLDPFPRPLPSEAFPLPVPVPR